MKPVRKITASGERSGEAASSVLERPPLGRALQGRLTTPALLLPVPLALVAGVAVLLLGHTGHHPQRKAIEAGRSPALEASTAAPARSASAATGAQAPGAARADTAAEQRDPEEASSFPVSPASIAQRPAASSPRRAAEAFVAPGALSTARVRQALARLGALEHSAGAGVSTVPGGNSVGGNGTIPIPPAIPLIVQRVIAGANAIADYPYVYGGVHLSFQDNAYDCSGSISYALAAGGLLARPETSGELESWGAPGPGRWITIYANAGHVYMYVNVGDGVWMRFDTVGRSGPYASRWQPDARSNEGFVARHWPGL